jgi:hypothetical protein
METDMDRDTPGELALSANSRADFEAFLKALAEDFRRNSSQWDNNDLGSFLEGLQHFAVAVDGYYANMRYNVNASTPSWRLFADLLCGARVHS